MEIPVEQPNGNYDLMQLITLYCNALRLDVKNYRTKEGFAKALLWADKQELLDLTKFSFTGTFYDDDLRSYILVERLNRGLKLDPEHENFIQQQEEKAKELLKQINDSKKSEEQSIDQPTILP